MPAARALTHLAAHRSALGATLIAIAAGTALPAAATQPHAADGQQGAAAAAPAPTSSGSAATSQAPPEPAADAPLAFDPPLLDLGDVVPEVPTSAKVKVTNRSSQPLRVMRAVANCSCTKPEWASQVIQPGASSEATITMTPGVQQGVKLVKVVTFEIEGGKMAQLTVQGSVGKFVSLEPEFLKAPAMAADDSSTPSEFVLESADGTPFKVILVDPAIGESPGKEPALRQVVKIDWAKWREKRPIKVSIKTDHPKAPTFTPVLKRTKAAAADPKQPVQDTGKTP